MPQHTHLCVCTRTQMHTHSKTNTEPHLQPCCSVVLKTELIIKVPLCVSLKVASNDDVSLFKEFISRNPRYFSGILEIIQRGSTFFPPAYKHKHTYYGHTHASSMCDGLENRYKSFIDNINVVPPKNRH